MLRLLASMIPVLSCQMVSSAFNKGQVFCHMHLMLT